MTHILFVTGEYPPMEGGVGAYTREVATALAAKGVEVSIATSTHAAQHVGQASYIDARSQVALTVYPHFKHWGVESVGKVARLAKAIDAQWIHVQYQTAAFAMNPAINLAPTRWRRHFNVAWTYHDLLVPYLFPKAGASLRRWVTELPARTCQQTIVTNAGDQMQLASRGIHAEQIPIGSNISGTLHTSDQRQMRRRKRNFAHDDLVLGYFGFLNRSKGGSTVIRTLHRLAQSKRHVYLLMIGDVAGASDPTNQTYFAEIESLIVEFGLIDRVRWTGREEDGEVSADLGACDVLLLPYEDGASLRRGSLMAALANGCPIVTTRPTAPLPEFVEGKDLLYIAPGDVEEATRAVLRIASDRDFAMSLRLNAFERSKQFTWESIAQKHLAFYRNEGETASA